MTGYSSWATGDFDEYFIRYSELDSILNNNLFCWGYNYYGQLGDNTVVPKSSPVQTLGSNTWKQIDCGNSHQFITAIKNDRSLWVWGNVGSGEAGDNTITNRSSPTQIGSGKDWRWVANGNFHVVAIKTDGSLWSWGLNSSYGQLGDGTRTDRSSPVQIGSDTTWKQITCGNNFVGSIKVDGSLWMWGYNTSGQLGDSTVLHKSSPIQVGTNTDWKTISCGGNHTAAIKTNGSLWMWGYNNYGQLGDGTLTHRSSPVQIGAGTDWKQISCGTYNHCVAVKTNGTLWSWGLNGIGQLGDGTLTHRSSPVQIGAGTDWKQVACGYDHTISLKTDGTLWSWGQNSWGQLGDGTIISKSSPVNIGSESNWVQVAAGPSISSALKFIS